VRAVMPPSLDGDAAADTLRDQLRHVRGRSPLYERLIAGLAGAAERGFDGGLVSRLLALPGPRDVREARLLLLAALHHAALADPQAPHASWFPTAVDEPRPATEGAPAALALAYLLENESSVAEFISTHRLQTNEIGRCVGLLPGFLLAASYGLPLRLLEVGCAAGLNLRFDRYRYRYIGGPSWGPQAGPVLEASAEGAIPDRLVPPTVEVTERRGVDLDPIDPTDPDGARLLTAFVWPDEHDSHRRLREGIRVAKTTAASLETGDLVDWTEKAAVPVEGAVTVIFHSYVTHLLDAETSEHFIATTDKAVRAGSADGPVVHLRLEPPTGTREDPELIATIGDRDGPPRQSTLLTSDSHGRWVRWW
jgi:hypothetical protein